MMSRTNSFLARAASAEGEVALRSGRGQRTWGELECRLNQVANGLTAAGLEPGDAVAVLAYNRAEHIEVLLANLRGGLRHVPLNWHLTATEIAYILRNSDARWLFVDPEHEALARVAAKQVGLMALSVFESSYESWIEAQSDAGPTNQRAGAMMIYSSGTTGQPKGVIRADQPQGISDLVAQYRGFGQRSGYQDGGVHLVACPLYHAAPSGKAVTALMFGQSVLLMDRFDPIQALDWIERYRVTTTHLVPTQLIRLLKLDEKLRYKADMSSLELVEHGGGPCPEWAKRKMIEWLGPILVEYYGASEGIGPVVISSEEWLAHPGSVGKPPPWLKISVVDEHGKDLPPGEIGTLYFRRPDGAPSYHGDPQKSRSILLPDGRYTVGDIGRIDADGYLYIVDRKIDMIISGGVNIYPAEIESVLQQHPAVADCAVFGIPDDEWGERVKACVTFRDGHHATEEALGEWCKDRLAAFKCPASIDVLYELPREESGKLKKRKLRDGYWENAGRKI